jgi:hypothetical protein
MASGTMNSDAAKSQPNLPRNAGNDGRNSSSDGRSNSDVSLSDFERLVDDVTNSVVTYSKEQPKVVAAGIFVLGFIVGWKLKPW